MRQRPQEAARFDRPEQQDRIDYADVLATLAEGAPEGVIPDWPCCMSDRVQEVRQ